MKVVHCYQNGFVSFIDMCVHVPFILLETLENVLGSFLLPH